jgi:hypothetical protein
MGAITIRFAKVTEPSCSVSNKEAISSLIPFVMAAD